MNTVQTPKELKGCELLFSSASIKEVDGFLKDLLRELQSKPDSDSFKMQFKGSEVAVNRHSAVEQLASVISSGPHKNCFIHTHTSSSGDDQGRYFTSYNDIIHTLNPSIPLQHLVRV